MRPILVLGLALVVVAAVLWAVLGAGSGAGRGAPAGVPGVAPRGAAEPPLDEAAPLDVPERQPEPAAGGSGPGNPALVPDDVSIAPDDEARLARGGARDAAEFWRRCMFEDDPERMRACIREGLGGRLVEPEELAGLVCGEVPPDGPDRMLMEEVAARWPPDEAGRRMVAFHGLCNAPPSVWTDFLAGQAERDPEWLAAFGRSLRPEELYGGEDTVLLQALGALVSTERPELLALLDAGARGEFGAAEPQVAYAISKAFTQRAEATERLEFLRSVVTAPSFRARRLEVEAVVRSALDASVVAREPGAAFDFLVEHMADPLVGPGMARYVLELHRYSRLPTRLDAAQRHVLVRDAEAALDRGR